MNIPREAIEKAIEGGWNRKNHYGDICVFNDGDEWGDAIQVDSVALTPSFWQALGKGLGLKEALMALEYQKEMATDF